ncbi:hypothetical protein LCGC14_0551760 [marine sediment metagenome]|uniref:Uncharacterized protein n=1 Tax=marine sediment metagenome TaxID=412755 RepID=A0A0F9RPN6_9ZZZZ
MSNSDWITQAPWTVKGQLVLDPGGHVVAHCNIRDPEEYRRNNEANAQLIAEAPTLYGLIEAVLELDSALGPELRHQMQEVVRRIDR